MKRKFTCIVCPNGCEIGVNVENGEIAGMSGQGCPRGREYVLQEITAPRRTIASSVRVLGGELPVASVRLTAPVPKEKIFQVMAAIKEVVLTAPVEAGTIVLHNVCGLESDVMVTKNIAAVE